MSNFELLDDGIVYESLENDVVLIQSKKIATRVLILTVFFGVFSLFCSLVTMEALEKYSYSNSAIYFLLAALCTQLGTIFLTIRLFLYQRNIRKNNDWALVFETKYKVWRALAIVFALTLTSIVIMVLEANQLI